MFNHPAETWAHTLVALGALENLQDGAPAAAAAERPADPKRNAVARMKKVSRPTA